MQLRHAGSALSLALVSATLVGCAGPVESGTAPAPTLRLSGQVGLYGGPLNPKTGQMALRNAAPGVVRITVTSADRPTVHLHTDKNGRFAVRLAPGRYLVKARCGSAIHVRLTRGSMQQGHRQVLLVCAVP